MCEDIGSATVLMQVSDIRARPLSFFCSSCCKSAAATPPSVLGPQCCCLLLWLQNICTDAYLSTRPPITTHQQKGSPCLAMPTLSIYAPLQVGTRQMRLRREDQQVCSLAARFRGSPGDLLLQPWRTLYLLPQERSSSTRHRARVRLGPRIQIEFQHEVFKGCPELSIANRYSKLRRNVDLR